MSHIALSTDSAYSGQQGIKEVIIMSIQTASDCEVSLSSQYLVFKHLKLSALEFHIRAADGELRYEQKSIFGQRTWRKLSENKAINASSYGFLKDSAD